MQVRQVEQLGFACTSIVGRKVDVDPFDVVYVNDSSYCGPGGFFPPLGRDGYGSYDECANECALDSRCASLTFLITLGDGGDKCPEDYTPQRCGARCSLLPHNCSDIMEMPESLKISPEHDAYHVGRKVEIGCVRGGGAPDFEVQ